MRDLDTHALLTHLPVVRSVSVVARGLTTLRDLADAAHGDHTGSGVAVKVETTGDPSESPDPTCPVCAWASDLCDCPPPLPPVEALLPLWRRYVDESRGIDRVMDAETEGSGL